MIAPPASLRGRLWRRLVLLPLAAATFGLSLPRAQAQDIGELFQTVQEQTQARDWEAALTTLEEIVQRFGAVAKEEIGPRFGAIYYTQGVCFYETKQYGKAADAFQKSYEDFGNANADTTNQNPYWETSLFRWAASEQAQGNYEKAIELFTKFRESNPTPGSYSEAAWFLSMGICHAELGNVDDAEKFIGKAFEDSVALGATPAQLIFGFKSLAEAWIGTGKAASDAANAFLTEHGEKMRMSLWEMRSKGLDTAFIVLGAEASDAGMETFAIRLFSYVPLTNDVVQELQQRAASYPTVPPKLQAEIDKYQAEFSSGDPIEIKALIRMANAYSKLGSKRSAFVVYDYLASNYPNTSLRPEILYGATSMGAGIGEQEVTQFYGIEFLTKFPDSEYRKDVAALMLGQLFQDGEYQEAYDLGMEVRQKMPEGSPQRELPDFVVGGSLFFLGDYEGAESELARFVETYEKSEFLESALYHHAAAVAKQFRWDDAIALLTDFRENYPDSSFTDLVLLDLANARFAQRDYGKAQEMVIKIKEEYPDSQGLDGALLVEGDIYQYTDKPEEAIASYEQALEAARRLDHPETEANALSQLVTVAASINANDKVLTYYDAFQEDYAGTYFEPMAVTAAMPALAEAGRADEGLEKMEGMIQKLGSDPNSDQLERLVNTYAKFFLELRSPEALVARLTNFPDVPLSNVPLRAWLTMARVDVLEDPANAEKFPNRDAQIVVAYRDLRELPKDQLAPYILMKVGRNVAESGSPEEAEPWFTQIIDSGSDQFKQEATLGLARAYQNSKNPDKQGQALALYKRVLAGDPAAATKESALVGVARILMDQERYQRAIDEALLEYMNAKQFSSHRAEISYKLGKALEETGDEGGAFKAYLNTYVNYPGRLEFSAPAYYSAAQLQWDIAEREGDEAKKRNAYAIIDEMVKRMGDLQGNPLDTGDYIRRAKNLRDAWASQLGIIQGQQETR